MKKIFCSIAVVAAFVSGLAMPAHAEDKPLLKKSYIPNQWQPQQPAWQCQLYANKLVIVRAIGVVPRIETVETKNLAISDGAVKKIAALVALAEEGEIRDGEITALSAPLLKYETPQKLILQMAFVGQWKTDKVNTSNASELLVNLLDMHCPEK